ncbi:hypothetical protein BJ742DRAFT_238907 [Cladochytrium replicatum]|nr:hypothetical protein BJ742DRAFT_238907 [Cladochytrium replicatum]
MASLPLLPFLSAVVDMLAVDNLLVQEVLWFKCSILLFSFPTLFVFPFFAVKKDFNLKQLSSHVTKRAATCSFILEFRVWRWNRSWKLAGECKRMHDTVVDTALFFLQI